ncbi:MAG: hypothetical protein K2N14_01505 [Clostridia bacterium]|nr:hypothetical protein [Clostridia bacterium]
MSRNKKKIRKLSEEQYNEYIASLKNPAALFSADGKMLIPSEYEPEENDKKQGE